MIIPKPLRVAGIILCGMMLLLPAGVCFTGASDRVMRLMHFISVLSPVPFCILVQVCIDEGRAREQERARRESEPSPATTPRRPRA